MTVRVDFENGRVEEEHLLAEGREEVKLTSKNILYGSRAQNSMVLKSLATNKEIRQSKLLNSHQKTIIPPPQSSVENIKGIGQFSSLIN